MSQAHQAFKNDDGGKVEDSRISRSWTMGYSDSTGRYIHSLERRVINGKAYIDMTGADIGVGSRLIGQLGGLAQHMGIGAPVILRESRRDEHTGVVRFATGNMAELMNGLFDHKLVSQGMRDFVVEQEALPGNLRYHVELMLRAMQTQYEGMQNKLAMGRQSGSGNLQTLLDYGKAHVDELVQVFSGQGKDTHAAAESLSALMSRDRDIFGSKPGVEIVETGAFEQRQENRNYTLDLQNKALDSFFRSQSTQRQSEQR
jgi:hypothetical protein